jgi:hypothetical protein
VLAAVGLCTGGPIGLVLGVAALGTAMLAIAGPDSLLFQVYKAIPGFAMFRFPTRLLLATALFTAVAAALGGTRLAGARVFARPWRRRLLEATVLGAGFAILVVPIRAIGLAPWAAGPGSRPDRRFFPGDQRPPDTYRVWTPSGRLDLGIGVFVRQGMREGVRVVQDYEAASGRRLGTFLTTAAGRPPWPADDLVLFTGALLDDPPIERPALADAVSARTIMMTEQAAPRTPPAGWTEIARPPRYVVYRNDRALPRAYLVERASVVADEAGALDALVSASFDVHTEAVLVGTPDAPDARMLSAGPKAPAIPASFAIDEPERLVVDVDPSRPSVLVLTDTFAAGWSASVDGTRRELRQANYLGRGVTVGPGDRRVEFRYEAPGLRAGLLMLLVGWSIALGDMARRWRGAPWRSAAPPPR